MPSDTSNLFYTKKLKQFHEGLHFDNRTFLYWKVSMEDFRVPQLLSGGSEK